MAPSSKQSSGKFENDVLRTLFEAGHIIAVEVNGGRHYRATREAAPYIALLGITCTPTAILTRGNNEPPYTHSISEKGKPCSLLADALGAELVTVSLTDPFLPRVQSESHTPPVEISGARGVFTQLRDAPAYQQPKRQLAKPIEPCRKEVMETALLRLLREYRHVIKNEQSGVYVADGVGRAFMNPLAVGITGAVMGHDMYEIKAQDIALHWQRLEEQEAGGLAGASSSFVSANAAVSPTSGTAARIKKPLVRPVELGRFTGGIGIQGGGTQR